LSLAQADLASPAMGKKDKELWRSRKKNLLERSRKKIRKKLAAEMI